MRAFTLLFSLLYVGQQVLSNPLKISINIDDDEPQSALKSINHHVQVTDESDFFNGPFTLQAVDHIDQPTNYYLSYGNFFPLPPRLALQGKNDINSEHGVFTLKDGQLKMGERYVHYDAAGWLLLLPVLPDILVRWRVVDVEYIGSVLVPYFDHPLEPLFFTPDIRRNTPVYACGVPEVVDTCGGEPNVYLVLQSFGKDL